MLHPISHAFATNLRCENISCGVRDKQRVKIIMICVSISSQKINKTHLSIARSFIAIYTVEDLRTPAARRRRRIVFCDFLSVVCVTETDVSAKHVCTIVHLKTLACLRFGRTTAATTMCRLFAIHMIFTICDAAETQQIHAIECRRNQNGNSIIIDNCSFISIQAELGIGRCMSLREKLYFRVRSSIIHTKRSKWSQSILF